MENTIESTEEVAVENEKTNFVRIHLDDEAPEGVTLASVGAASAPNA